ncbi:MAG TPA: serine/threonine protein kinase [Thermoanaerobaculia bacterium]|nr:serine/threonine protein kinase [Thermoanaerobaculia bacterium]
MHTATRFARRLRTPGLLLQIAAALAAVGTIPLLLAGFQLVRVNRDALLEQLLRTHTVAARATADQIDSFLADRRALGATLVADPRLAALASPEAQALLRDSLAGWSAAGVAGIAVHDAEGQLAVRVQTRPEAATIERLLDASPDPAPEIVRDAERLWVVVPVTLPGGAGQLALAADATVLDQALTPDELGEQAHVLLLDRSGQRLAGDPMPLDELPPALLEAALTGHLSGAGRFPTESGPEVVGAWSAADDGRWVVVSTQPADIAEAAARRMAHRSAVALLLALTLTVLLSLAAWRGLVKPLRALLTAQRQVAGLTRSPTPGSETAAMRSALSAMERHARDREALGEVFLGRYQVLEILGSGGMGTVFRGWDPRLQRPVALKTIHVARDADAKRRERQATEILAEAIRAAQITHRNVVGIFDAEESADVAYVAMEYVDGIGLDRYLEERGRLDWREVVPLAREIAAGLSAAHALGLVHRDVKPGNVLLGRDGTIKLADFGLATYVHLRVEAPGKVFGTPGFLAPEVLRGEPFDARADLYALGVVLFRALVGRYPFRGTSFREIVQSTVRDPTPRAEDLAASMPEDVAGIVAGLLGKDPAVRPGPADELAARLDRIAAHERLRWRLDFAHPKGELDAREVFAPAALPTLQDEAVDLDERAR